MQSKTSWDGTMCEVPSQVSITQSVVRTVSSRTVLVFIEVVGELCAHRSFVWHDQCNSIQDKYFNYRMILSDDTVGNGQLDQFWMLFQSDPLSGMSQVHHCQPGLTRQLLGWVTNESMFVYADNSYCFWFRSFKVRGGFRQHLYCSEYTVGFSRPEFSRIRSSASAQSTRYDFRATHVRGDETRISYCSSTRRDQVRTSHCVREESKQLDFTKRCRCD